MNANARIQLATFAALCSVALSAVRAQNAPARWALDAKPSITIGLDDRDPAAILQRIVSATRLPDGAILVGDLGDFALKRYSAAGQYERSFARKGSGPGEVRYLAWMLRCGDSTYTFDIGEGHRVSVFAPDGHYVRTFRFRGPPSQQSPYASACNAAGDFVHLGWGTPSEIKPGIHRSLVPVWTSRGDSIIGRTIDSVPGSERWGIAVGGQLRGSRPLPLGKQPVVGIGRSHVYVGSADRFQLKVFDLAGRQGTALQRPEAPTGVARQDIRNEIEREVAEAGEPRRASIERALADITFPTTLPAYTDLLVDTDDQAWVRAFPKQADDAVRWSVFAPTGALVAEVAMPKHLHVFEIGRDYVLGRYLDPEEAIPQVRLYHLTHGARPVK